jgi:hypothetical protein
MSRAYYLAGAVGAIALFFLASASSPARADDRYYRDDRYHRDLHRDIDRDRRDIRQDFDQIRRDDARLCELERERDRYRRCKDWRAAKDVEREIGYLKRQINDEKRDVKKDIQDIRRDEKREREFHDRRDRDRYYLERDRDRY